MAFAKEYPQFDLAYPELSSDDIDRIWKIDWLMRRKPPATRRVGVQARFLHDPDFTGRYMVVSGRTDYDGVTHSDEYAIWLHGARGLLDTLLDYWFHLVAWTDGKTGPILSWAVVDMPHWASKSHQLVTGDAFGDYTARKGHWDAIETIPCNRIIPSSGRPFYRFPIPALKTYEVF